MERHYFLLGELLESVKTQDGEEGIGLRQGENTYVFPETAGEELAFLASGPLESHLLSFYESVGADGYTRLQELFHMNLVTSEEHPDFLNLTLVAELFDGGEVPDHPELRQVNLPTGTVNLHVSSIYAATFDGTLREALTSLQSQVEITDSTFLEELVEDLPAILFSQAGYLKDSSW